MKIEDVRKCAAEQGIAEEEAPNHGMEAKSKEFLEKGAEVCAKGLGSVREGQPGLRSTTTFETPIPPDQGGPRSSFSEDPTQPRRPTLLASSD